MPGLACHRAASSWPVLRQTEPRAACKEPGVDRRAWRRGARHGLDEGGDFLASAALDGTARVWHAEGGACQQTLRRGLLRKAQFVT